MLNIVGRRYWFFAFSFLIIIPGLIAIGMTWAQTGQPFRLAIDFTGGTLLELKFAKPQQFQTDEIVKIFGQFDLSANDVHVQPSGNDTLIIRTKTLDNEVKVKAEELIRARFGDFVEQRAESVGPAVGAEVAQRAAGAVALAMLAILLYITWAFRRVPQPFRYGVCALVSLVHDAFIVMGVAAIFGLLFGWEVDALFLTALLTVIGFSVHDTIVVFDRIRENLSRIRGVSFEEVVNHSILQTLDRSINTVLTTLFVLAALMLFGGITIRQFAITLFIGIFSGMFSSIFTAAPLLVVWENNEIGKFFQRLSGKQKTATA
ncbi:MAG: protein translocase subunit SecF [Chloroflexi bacterium]|nr:protein translocase subunit SecF [Chloroflexota bacterium]